MRCSGTLLSAAQAAYLGKWLSTDVLANIAAMSTPNVLYGQTDSARLSRRTQPPPEHLYTGIDKYLLDMKRPEERRYGGPCFGTVLTGGLTAMIGRTIYNAKEGDWLIVPPDTLHREFCMPSRTPYHMLWLHQAPPEEQHEWSASLCETTLSASEDFGIKVYRIAKRPPPEITQSMRSILTEPHQPLDLLRYNLMRIVTWWLSLVYGNTDEITVQTPPIVARLQALLDQPDNPSLSVKSLARQVGASTSHISRTFHSSTGQTIRQAIQNARIERAKEHLADSSLTIKEIASLIGFASPEHFTRAFSRIVGVPPTLYRSGKRPRPDQQ